MPKTMTLRGAIAAALLGLSVSSYAIADTPKPVDIPAGDLRQALLRISEQFGTDLVYSPLQVQGVTTRGAQGYLTTEQAVTKLLEGTQLQLRKDSSGAMLIAPPATKDASRPSANAAEQPKSLWSRLRLAQADARATSRQDEARTETQTAAEPAGPAPEKSELEEIVVTGTHIRGLRKSASPLLTFDREQIARTGFSTLDQFVESLPQNSGAGASQDTAGLESAVGNDAYGNAINLRSLGAGTTLVLLNGRRVAGGGNSGRFVDISMIPLSAIERVEVLTDGASAIYGSDAVGGVVNFVLKRDYEGAETGLRYGRVTEGGLREVQVSQSLGADWDGGGTILAYEYNHRDALDARDRAFTAGNELPRNLLPEQEHHSIFASAHHDLSDRWSFFADALYSRRQIDNVATYFSLLNEEEADAEEIYGAAGADFAVSGDWRLRMAASYSRYSHDQTFIRTALPDGEPDPMASTVDNDVWSLDALLDGSLMTLPGGALRLAVGASHRRETLDLLTTTLTEAFPTSPPERQVNAAFGELFIPLFGSANRVAGIEALELTIAARYERYNDFGDAVTPKLAVRWEPVRALSLRATYGESFKAPALVDLVGGTEGLGAFFPSDLGLNVPGDPLVLLRTQNARPRLHEEQSRSWTAGFDSQPEDSSFALAVTYFDIEFEDRIASPLSAGFELFLTSPEVFGDFLIPNPSAEFINARFQPPGAVVDFSDLTGGLFAPDAVGLWADASVTNIALSRQSGVDVAVDHAVDGRWGRFDLSLNGTYILEFEDQAAPRAAALDLLNLLNQPIDLRLRAGLTWSGGEGAPLSASLFVNYQDDYRNTDTASSRIASWTTFDAQIRYEFQPSKVGGVLAGVTLALSAQNLLDEDPPFVPNLTNPIAHFGFDPVNATPLGRFIAAQFTKAW